jgi:ubiquinol-cytochrome c reductase cytochrome c subunit
MRRAVLAAAALALLLPGALGAQEKGQSLYLQHCVSCHGLDLGGMPPQGSHAGPPLRGVGAQAADFYLTTGYMPLERAGREPKRKRSPFTDDEIDELVRYVASFGGPPVPRPHPERGSVSEGLRLFTENCAGCHQVAGAGGLVVGGVAPRLNHASATQIAEAVRIGPYLMPKFTRRQLSDRQVDSIVRYVEQTKHPDDRGGWSLAHIGPIPEGLVAWLLAGSALIGGAAVIGGRAR